MNKLKLCPKFGEKQTERHTDRQTYRHTEPRLLDGPHSVLVGPMKTTEYIITIRVSSSG